MKLVKIFKCGIIKKVLIFFVAFLVIYGIMLTSLVTKKYDVREGDIAKVDIKAPREVLDRISTEERKKQAIDAVGPQYTLKTDIESSAEDDINNQFTQIVNIRNMNIDAKLKSSNLRNTLSYNFLSDSNIDSLVSVSKEDISSLQVIIIKTLKETFSKTIRQGSNEDIKTAKDYVNTQINNSKLNKDLIGIASTITSNYIKPNMYLDETKMKELKDEAEKKVQAVLIKKDQTIVKEGEPVTKEQIEVLKDLGLLNNNNSNWYIYIYLALLILIILSITCYYLNKYRKDLYKDNKKIILVFSLFVISLILARTISVISPFLIPLSCVPILLTILFDNEASVVLGILNCVLIGGVVEFNSQVTLIAIMSTVLIAIIIKKIQVRNDIMNAAFYVSIINGLLTFSVGYLLSNNMMDILKISGFVLLGGGLSAILAIGFLPFFENIFDIVTTIKLLELSNPNHPLLKRLLMEAPGTYHHSIIVANLAEVAAEEVGANPVLTRVSAYYHDIGKIKRPYFFKENQIGKENPHDKLNPNLSTLVITSHVKDGLDLAKEYNLPTILQNIIVEHHGTTLVKYFYITMKNSSEKPEEVKPENFKYAGPIPSSKECGIIMMADSIEAAVRSIQEPNQNKIEEMVNNIIKDRLSEGQFDNCDLTLKDIYKVKKSFLKTLTGVYHQRIEYPVEKTQKTLQE